MTLAVIAMLCALFVLLFAKVPVFLSVFGAAAVYFLLTPGLNPAIFAQQAITGTESIPLLAIPFFVAAGVLMNNAGVTQRIMDLAIVLTGRLRGGLAQVNVVLSLLMGGLSGSALADAAMQSKILVPAMVKQGISRTFSSVLTAASSIITPLIPPGIGLIIYGSIAHVSIGKLFIAGIVPGALLAIVMMIFVSRISKRRGYEPLRTTRPKVREIGTPLRHAILPLCLPVIIIGGIRFGIFTTTEAGAVAVIYVVLLGLFYRKLRARDLLGGLKETIVTTASILLIIAAAATFSWILTREMIPQQFSQLIVGSIHNEWLFLLAVGAFLLIVGMFIEGNATMIVLVPLFAPIAAAFGLDPIHFAMVFIFANTVGAFTPPVGTLMFVVNGITKTKTADFIREAVPFYVLFGGFLLLLMFVPQLSTGLVDLLY